MRVFQGGRQRVTPQRGPRATLNQCCWLGQRRWLRPTGPPWSRRWPKDLCGEDTHFGLTSLLYVLSLGSIMPRAGVQRLPPEAISPECVEKVHSANFALTEFSDVQHAREGAEPKRSSLCFVVPLRLCGPPATQLDHRMSSTR